MPYIKTKHLLVVLQIPILVICMKLSATERPSFCDEAAYVENGYLLVSGNADSTDETDAREKAFGNAEKEVIKYFNGNSRIREIESVRTDTQKFRGVYSVCRLLRVKLIEKNKEEIVETDTGKIVEIREYTEIEAVELKEGEEPTPRNRYNETLRKPPQPTLILTTDPIGAEVQLFYNGYADGGVLLGYTKENGLTSNQHADGVLMIAKDGYKVIRVSGWVYLHPGKTLKMHFKLTPAPGTVITNEMMQP